MYLHLGTFIIDYGMNDVTLLYFVTKLLKIINIIVY